MDNEDLVKQENLDNNALLLTLRERYESAEIYTNCGLLMLSINPYGRLDIYSNTIKESYKKGHNLKPHIFQIIEESLANIKYTGTHSIIISGESGSGKTECTKIILNYLELNKIECVDTILESMGNARTARNNNSSRFGKLICIGEESLTIETFLLEKSRVTGQSNGEQNFHIFYYLLAGNNLLLENDYITLKSSRQYKEKYAELRAAFTKIGLDFQYVERVLLSVLHIGSLSFENGDELDDELLTRICKTFNINKSDLVTYLTHKILKVRDEIIKKEYSPAESKMFRDSLARLIYSKVFEYVIYCINEYFKKNKVDTPFDEAGGLNILDIFGFENFESNGLDQFCINWCNEKLYDEFVSRMFDHQKRIFEEEELVFNGIQLDSENLQMSRSALDMIEKQCGLIDLIAEESFINGTPTTLCNKISKYLNLPIKYGKGFTFNHYAENVDYNCEDFVNKNKERADFELIRNNKFILEGDRGADQAKNVVGYFRKSMNRLFEVLNKTNLKYIKCIKPNEKKAELLFDSDVVSKQLVANGILQTIQLSKHIYSCHMYIDEFEERYDFLFELVTKERPNLLNYDKERILASVRKGKTRYFYNNPTLKELEKIRFALKSIKLNVHKRHMERIAMAVWRAYKQEKDRIEEERIRQERELVDRLERERIEEETAMRNKQQAEMEENQRKKLEKKLAMRVESKMNAFLKSEQVDERDEDRTHAVEQMEVKKTTTHQNTVDSEHHNTAPKRKDNMQQVKLHPTTRSKPCSNCILLEKKYKIQTRKLIKLQGIELEVEKLRKQIKKLEHTDDSSDSLDSISPENVFSCLVQIYIDHAPLYSDRDIPKEEMLSLAHGLFYGIDAYGGDFNRNVAIALDEVATRIHVILDHSDVSNFFMSNLIEFYVLCVDSRGEDLSEINLSNILELIHVLYTAVTKTIRAKIGIALPFAIIEHQEIKELRVKVSIFKKLFTGCSIDQLLAILDEIVDRFGFYYTPENFIHSLVTYILKYVDCECFNSLLIKRNYLSINRCAQINYNISELNKFCYRIGYVESNIVLCHISEAIKLGTAMGVFGRSNHAADRAHVDNLIEQTMLNRLQINTINELYTDKPIERLNTKGSIEKFIREPMIEKVTVELYSDVSSFVMPKYVPYKAIKSIIKIIESKETKEGYEDV